MSQFFNQPSDRTILECFISLARYARARINGIMNAHTNRKLRAIISNPGSRETPTLALRRIAPKQHTIPPAEKSQAPTIQRLVRTLKANTKHIMQPTTAPAAKTAKNLVWKRPVGPEANDDAASMIHRTARMAKTAAITNMAREALRYSKGVSVLS